MECNSSDLNVSRQKRQRTEDDKTRSAMLDFSVLDCPICMEPLSIPIFQMNNSDNCLVPREYSEEELLLEVWDGSDIRAILRYPDPDPYPADP
ncbi:hypothetical protein YC2023_036956 [Brassica napus]